MNAEILHAILDSARFAPSPDNVQPWRFVWNGAQLNVLHLEDRARHSLNPENYASYLAFGGLVTYLEQASEAQGYRALTEFTSDWAQDHWLTIRFEKSETAPESAQLDLRGRWTDRQPYAGGSLDEGFWARCRQHVPDGIGLHHAPVSPELSRYVEVGELLFLVSATINKDVLEWVHFDDAASNESPFGMPFRSLGANKLEVFILKLLRDYPGLRAWLLRAGASSMARSKTRSLLRSSSGCYLVTVPEITPLQILAAGRASIYAWLCLNQQGFSCQPMSSACFGTHYGRMNLLPADTPAFMLEHFAQGAQRLKGFFALGDDERPAWMFRFGATRSRPERPLTRRASVDSLLATDA